MWYVILHLTFVVSALLLGVLDRSLRLAPQALIAPTLPAGRQPERGLPEEIFPSLRRADVGVAEPESPVERHAFPHAFQPEPCRHDGRVARDTHDLRAGILVLDFVEDLLFPRSDEVILAGDDPAVAEDQDHVVVQDPVDRRDVVIFHRGLELGVEGCNGLAVLFGRSLRGRGHRKAHGEQRDGDGSWGTHACIRQVRWLE